MYKRSPADFYQIQQLNADDEDSALHLAWAKLLHRDIPPGVSFVSSSGAQYVGMVYGKGRDFVFNGQGALLLENGCLPVSQMAFGSRMC